MGLFRKKEKPILNPNDVIELRELERQAYMEEAKKLVLEKGKADARKNIQIRKEDPYA